MCLKKEKRKVPKVSRGFPPNLKFAFLKKTVHPRKATKIYIVNSHSQRCVNIHL